MRRILNSKKFITLNIAILAIFCFAGLLLNCDDGPVVPGEVGPNGMAFYTPPSPLPTVAHGDLIWYRPVTYKHGPEVDAYTIMYQSTDAVGNANAVTGTVLVPTKDWHKITPRDIVVYGIGTHGLRQDCGASFRLLMDQGKDYELSNINALLEKNVAVLITDYPGYTNGDTPTYMAGIAQGNALLDIPKAAFQIADIRLNENADIAIWGYSQGGQAAAFAAELQPTYVPKMNLLGVAAGGVPADFLQVAPGLDGKNGAAFLLSTVIGLWTQYPEGIPLPELVNSAGEQAIDEGKDMCVFEALEHFHNKSLSEFVEGGLTIEELMAIPSVNETLVKQTLGTRAPQVPVLLYHGTSDEFIPLEQALQLKEKYCSLGVSTEFLVYHGEHITTMFQAQHEVLPWLQDLFNELPPLSGCGSHESQTYRPVSTSNPLDGDFIVTLNNWHLDAWVKLATLNDTIDMPEESIFWADTNMTKKTIAGDLFIPRFESPVWVTVLPFRVQMNITSTTDEPFTGTASLDSDGVLHVHGHMWVDIALEEFSVLDNNVHTEEPVDYPIDFDGPVSSLGDGTLTFSGETYYPRLEGDMGEIILTMFMSGDGQEYSFTVRPIEPIVW